MIFETSMFLGLFWYNNHRVYLGISHNNTKSVNKTRIQKYSRLIKEMCVCVTSEDIPYDVLGNKKKFKQ